MRKLLFVLLVAALGLFFFAFRHAPQDQDDGVYVEKEGELLLPQHNVAIAVVDLEAAGLSLRKAADIPPLRQLHKDFTEMPGAVKVESLLNVSRVVSEGDDIIVSSAIPSQTESIRSEYLRRLSEELPDFPELSPYINEKQDTLLYYLYFSNDSRPADIHRFLSDLKKEWKDTIPFEYTGKAPIVAETEAKLTTDIAVFFPILALMVILVFSLFRSLRALAVSVFLMVLAMTVAYGFVRYIGLPPTPLILLIPVFSLGLLSDYLIHYFYHRLHPHAAEEGSAAGFASALSIRRRLFFPLTLTALSTITGFLSLSLINGSGHLQVGLIIAAAVLITWSGVFFWIDYLDFVPQQRSLLKRFRDFQGRIFKWIAKYRYLFFLLIAAALLWGGIQLKNLTIEPYPIEQLPESTSIRKADERINEDFYGTLPFFLEIDTGEKMGIMKKETLLRLDDMHGKLEEGGAGYAFSLLSVLKRMNYYFMGSEETLLTSTEFDDFYDALIEQYLLYYSSSVDPLEYESMLDNSYRFFSVKGLLYYHNYADLDRFLRSLEEIEADFPEGWTMSLHGGARELREEHERLRANWLLSFLAGSFLIFITVLVFYRRIGLALISLFPGFISMIISFGFISMAGISIDIFSIIFVAIITGLVIDYSIHTLIALDQLTEVKSLEESFTFVVGYSGIPIFLSFMTSLLSFFVLLLSSFSGARSLGFLLITSLVLSFFLSLYLLPLIILPHRLNKESSDA
jgi:uncharacterized protein